MSLGEFLLRTLLTVVIVAPVGFAVGYTMGAGRFPFTGRRCCSHRDGCAQSSRDAVRQHGGPSAE